MQGSSLPSTDARLLTDILNVNTVPLDNVAVLRLRMLVARSLPLARRHNYRVVARTERTSLVAFRSDHLLEFWRAERGFSNGSKTYSIPRNAKGIIRSPSSRFDSIYLGDAQLSHIARAMKEIVLVG